MNNRCNLRSLSIFQITDKHVADDCSQTGGLRGGIAKTTRLEKIAVLKTVEESDHHLLMKALLMGDAQTHPSHSHSLTLGLDGDCKVRAAAVKAPCDMFL